MDVGRGDGESRLFELRLSRIADAAVRDDVARRVTQRFPSHDHPSLVRALSDTGIVIRVELSGDEAPALLRDLYIAGVAPVAVVLSPVGPVTVRRGEPDDARSSFELFARHGGRFVPTWSWPAFLFGPFWYLRKGLWGKGLILLALSLVPIWTLLVTLLASVLILVYCGLAGRWDYYLWKVKRTQWW